MNHAQATAARPRPVKAAILRALERLAVRTSATTRTVSGVFSVGEEFVGLDRLDRADLDETDDDAR